MARADDNDDDEDDEEYEEEYDEVDEEADEAMEDDDSPRGKEGNPETELADGEFFCDEIVQSGLPTDPGVPAWEELFAGMRCQP